MLLFQAGRRCSNLPSFVRSITSSLGCLQEGFEHAPVIGSYSPITKKLWLERLSQGMGRPSDKPPQKEFLEKTPKKLSATYGFEMDIELKHQYRNPWGFVRMGRVLEDLDSLAGNIAYGHCDDNDPETRPPVLVTASVDRIQYDCPIALDKDAVISGQVVWVGRSSMDIRMELLQNGKLDAPSLVAWFTFVARDAVTGKATKINPIAPTNELERQWFKLREDENSRRKLLRKAKQDGTFQVLPEHQERARGLLCEARTVLDLPALADGGGILMEHTRMQNTFVCQPQQRNIHGRMFGGFLMRRAFELAFSTCYMYGGARPAFKMVDDITFRAPVNIGDLLRLRSRVVHMEASGDSGNSGLVHVEVVASTVNPEHLSSQVTNTFNFMLEVKDSPRRLKRILPANDEEVDAMCRCLASKFH